MDKLEKVVKGKNIKHMLDAFFNKYIRKHFNEINSIDFIISDLGEQMNDGGRNIKILRNDNPVRTNNPDWFPPKPQQTDHICTFLKQLMDNELGTKDSYVGLKAEVVTENETYIWDVKEVNYYESSGTVILRTDPRQGITIECPAIVRLYIYPLLTSKAVSSIIYNSIVTSESKYNFILGERNIHKGEDNVWIFGKNNISGETNHNSLINGYNNDVDSYGNIVIGDSNKHRSLLGATIGRYIKNFKQNSFLFGTGHDNSNGPSHEAVFGKYSNIEADTAFAIGDGEDENNRHNLFEVKYGGAILDKDGNDLRNSGGQQVQSDWNESDDTKPAFIKNKPTIPDPFVQEQSDWNETDVDDKKYIKNKPYISNNNNHNINYDNYSIGDNNALKVGDIVCNLDVQTNKEYYPKLTIQSGVIGIINYQNNRWDYIALRNAIVLVKPSENAYVEQFYVYFNFIKIDRDLNTNIVSTNLEGAVVADYISKPRIKVPVFNNHCLINNDTIILICNEPGHVINKNIYKSIILYHHLSNNALVSNNSFHIPIKTVIFGSLNFKFCTNKWQSDDDNINFMDENNNSIYLLRGNFINGNISYIQYDTNIKIKFIGVAHITSGESTSNILRTSIISFEANVVVDFNNFNIISEDIGNFKELQVLNNN